MKQEKDQNNISLSGAIGFYGTGITLGTTTTTFTFILTPHRVHKNTEVVTKDGVLNIEITYEEVVQNYFYTNGSPYQKNIVKDIYGVANGKLEIIKTIRGKEIEGYYVPAAIEWDTK